MQSSSRSRMPVNLVVVTANGRMTRQLQEAPWAQLSNPIFFLEGGLHGYREYQVDHALQLARMERGPAIKTACDG